MIDITFKHRCTSKTPCGNYLARVKDGPIEKCLGTYSSELEAANAASEFKEKRLRRICKEYGHELEDGVIVEQYYILFDNADIFVTDTAHKLKPGLNGAGYLFVRLNCKPYRLHRLVAEYFVKNEYNKPCVNHIDGNKLNNDASNLEWCTQSENMKHAFDTGLKIPANLKGDDCPWSKLTSKDVKYIREHYIPRDKNFSQHALAKRYGVCQQMISSIIRNKRWNDGSEVDNSMIENKKKEKIRGPFLYDYQMEAVNKLRNGCILCGSVGSGKSRTGLFYYFKENGGWIDEYGYVPMKHPQDLYIISTAKKRDSLEWTGELSHFLLSTDPNHNKTYGNKIVVDSWNNLPKYQDVEGAFFLLDEQRLVSYGAWTKAFLKIAKNNKWILLTATPADTYQDYLPVFLANGFFKNKTEFNREHVVFSRYTKYPKIDKYVNTQRLDRLRDRVLVKMNYKHEINTYHEDCYCDYNIQLYKDTIRKRWDPYKNEPIEQASGLCYVLRRIVNSDESRQAKLLEILDDYLRAIIFYNFTYELEILRNLSYSDGVEVAEYNGQKHQPIPEGDKWVYLCQYNSCSEGWECIRTNCIIFFSQNYSYKMMTQAAGRIDRLNTPYTDLYYYHLKSRANIDISISRALTQKKKFNETRWAKRWER